MFKVGKVLVLSLLVVGLCAPLALATTSRVQALAGAGSYINDDSDIFRWYGTLPSYSKMVMAEVGDIRFTEDGSYYQALGFTHDWGEDHWLGTWGIFLLKNSIEDGSFYLFNPLPTLGLGADHPSTKFALTWGKDLGSLSLGVMFTRSDLMFQLPGGRENALNFMTLGAGVRWDISEAAYSDISVTLGLAGGDTLGGFDKNMSYNLEGRLFYEFTDNATLVPYIGYRAAEYSLEDIAPTSGDKSSDLMLGASLDFDVNTNNMLVFATELEFYNWEPSKKAEGDEQEFSATVLPRFYVALESDITSWFTARVGATKTMVKMTAKDEDGNEVVITDPRLMFLIDEESMDDFMWFLGGGFHVGEWDIDAVFDPSMPFRLGYWLTGYASDEPPIGRVSATYRF
ncbi:MAG: hypothetical protein H6Q78_189 [Candidatus Krumholzibacteriota bacterium]|nr:hypothetical protein [Candidatus Krumholzibacteriota bacterium]